jgi:putative transposase
MPWKVVDKAKARRAFVELFWTGHLSLAEACRRSGISRRSGYRWLGRAEHSGWARLVDKPHRTRAAEALQRRWLTRVLAMRRAHAFAGPEQVRWQLQQRYRLGPWPSARTISRWLKAAGMSAKRQRHARPGPCLQRPRRVAMSCNDVWTVDFKGWFYTGDGQRVQALTVRDLASRYVLLVRHVRRNTDRVLRRIFVRLFRCYGVPLAIRTDNGPPFGGEGPRGWSSLSVWWARWGIEIEHGRPACPQDNAQHEQMHQVLKQQTASPPAPTMAAQQGRFDRWRVGYNHRRPHRGLGMHPPVCMYQSGQYRPQSQTWSYPSDWMLKRTDPRGRIRWRNQDRLIGRAFASQTIALKPITAAVAAVYFGSHLLGELHASDPIGMRAVRIQPSQTKAGRLTASPASPPLNPSKGGSQAPSLQPSPEKKL